MARDNSYTVAYYTGGTELGQWRLTNPYPTYPEAEAARREIIRGGRAAYVARAVDWANLGLPEGPQKGAIGKDGWDFKLGPKVAGPFKKWR